jgi:hypothetical protein
MPEFYIVVKHELTADDRAALETHNCAVVAEFGSAESAPLAEPPIPPEAYRSLEGTTGYVARVPAESESEALDRVAAAGIDDATIWRDFSAGALP